MARLSSRDRNELIQSFKRTKILKSSSKSSKALSENFEGVSVSTSSRLSANNDDWKSWMVSHGNKQEVEADVYDVGKIIGVKCHNMFNVLSRGKKLGGRRERVVTR